MSYIVLRRSRNNWYRYEITSYREDGQVKKRQKYLGRATEEEVAAWCAERGIQLPSRSKPFRGGQKRLRKAPRAASPPPLPRKTTASDSSLPEQQIASANGQRPPELLWFLANPSQQDHQEFLTEWLPRFKEKFGREPTVVYVNEADVEAIAGNGLGIEVEGTKLVQPFHYQIG